MTIKICVMTATRAEYGLLKPLMRKIKDHPKFELKVVATGAHLSPEFGFTYKEILNDGFNIDKKIEILLSSDTPSSISKSMGLAMIGFADYFSEDRPDLLVILGDRYESLAIASAALNERIPIAHLHGGETTEGAIDEAIRHAITKLSYLHFTSTEAYRDRVIQLGESPEKVFSVGALGIENILNEELLSRKDLFANLDINGDKPYALLTFHPTTLEDFTSEEQIINLLEVCKDRNDLNFIITKANADSGGRIINQIIDQYTVENDNIFSFTSLGLKRYLSAMKYTSFVGGNSSSGLLEAPSFGIPTVNIGDRQKGRIQAESVINCEPTYEDISKAFDEALSEPFLISIKDVTNPYGDGNTSDKIIDVINYFFDNKKINLKKKFYDLELSE